jgi:hypothetical protein
VKTLAIISELISGAWSLIFKAAIVILVIVGIVAYISSCANNATLNEHSSCQQFEQADSSTQDKVLQDMLTAHQDSSDISTVRLSVSLYCNLHDSNSPIDGVYNSSNVEQQTVEALHIQVPAMAPLYWSHAWSKTVA